jgi:CheY-like chemotaxis protein
MSYIDQIFETGQAQKPAGPRVLLVDDEPGQRELMGIRLESVGFNVEEVGSGYEALEKLKHFKYDAIVMDTQMPGMYGYEVCSQVRKTPLGQDLAILGMSGNNSMNFKRDWDEAEADVFLDKREITDFPYVLEKNIKAAVAYRRGV